MITTYLEVPVEVEFDHHPGCPEKLYGENVHPEEPAEIEIISIKCKEIDINTLDKKALDQIEKEIWEHLKSEVYDPHW